MSETAAFVLFAIASIALYTGAKMLDDRDRKRGSRSSFPPPTSSGGGEGSDGAERMTIRSSRPPPRPSSDRASTP